MTRISIALQFSPTVGFRFKDEGPDSGEEFRVKILEPLFVDPLNNELIEVNFDGGAGYPTSFLEEAFGGLARKFGKKRCIQRLKFVSTVDPLLIDEVFSYINAIEGD